MKNNDQRSLTLLELADLLGRYRFVELGLFSIIGEAVVVDHDARRSVLFSQASHAHGYRAALIEQRLPVSVGLPGVVESTRPPSDGHVEMLEELRALRSEVLIGHLARVWYPAMADAYAAHLNRCGEASDGPIRRMLGRVICDLQASISLVRTIDDETICTIDEAGLRSGLAGVGGPFGTLGL